MHKSLLTKGLGGRATAVQMAMLKLRQLKGKRVRDGQTGEERLVQPRATLSFLSVIGCHSFRICTPILLTLLSFSVKNGGATQWRCQARALQPRETLRRLQGRASRARLARGRHRHSTLRVTAMAARLVCESLRNGGRWRPMAVWSNGAAPGPGSTSTPCSTATSSFPSSPPSARRCRAPGIPSAKSELA